MDADLTCQRCRGTGNIDSDAAQSGQEVCRACAGSGRRRPTLDEWDDLRAERDRYWLALETIRQSGTVSPAEEAHRIARAALDAKEMP